MTTLQALRIYGPCTITKLAEATGLSWSEAGNQAMALLSQDLVACGDSLGGWDITPEGRLLFDARCAVRRDEQRACVGVREC